jgi:hypothetical protein
LDPSLVVRSGERFRTPPLRPFPKRGRILGERLESPNALAFEFSGVEASQTGDEREVVIRVAACVTLCPPPAYAAVRGRDRVRLGTSRRRDRFFEAPTNYPVVGVVVGYPE